MHLSPRLPRAGLTVRGRALVSAGLSILGCGLLLGQRDLTRLAILILALPLVSLGLALTSRPRLSVSRTVGTELPVVGQPLTIAVTVRNQGRRLDGLLGYDALPRALGPSPRFSMQSLPGAGVQHANYTITAQARGRLWLGPLRAVVTEPLGLATVTHRVGEASEVVVRPRVVPLVPAAQHDGSGPGGPGRGAAAGELSLSVREYRQGDDPRRVHWRSTARRGALMVRADEHAPARHATVLLDNRPGTHGSDQDLEHAVSLTASLCHHLRENGFSVALHAGGEARADDDLVTLATLPPTGTPGGLVELTRQLESAEGALWLVLGTLSAQDVQYLARIPHPHPVLFHRSGNAATPGIAELRENGWTTVQMPAGAGVEQIWASAEVLW